jgi:hypothetical protein
MVPQVTYENIDRTPLANLDLRGVGLKDLLLLLNYSLGEFDERGVEVTQSCKFRKWRICQSVDNVPGIPS